MAKGQKILVVDDTPENVELLNTLLSEKGYSVSGVPSGKIALQIVNEFEPDLILLDIMMPEMDGYQTCQRLLAKNSTKNTPIIFVTAKAEPEDIAKGFQCGAVDYITKPIKPEEVWARVKQQLRIVELDRRQEQLMQQLSLQENRYRTLIESYSNPIFTISYPGKISWCNGAASKITGKPNHELQDSKFVDLLAEQHQDRYRVCFANNRFGSGEDDPIIGKGPQRVDIKSNNNDLVTMDLTVDQADLNYPLLICHLHPLV
ncbi:MAG: response regulator [Kangiellaceae bacterium]|nr:response regulator [Kangiellaceae bacterium]MCW8999444.1 response regulator [Kangiellaceae bacterium]